MDSKDCQTTTKSATPKPTSALAMPDADPDPPVCYDSEPSSQPPEYGNAEVRTSVKLQNATHPRAYHTNSGAPALTVAALLADPEPESKEKRSMRERWKDWKERNFNDDGHLERKWDVRGSSTQWSVLGASVKGFENEKRRRLR
jgi:hypothetical protein